jgi:hypothetical protein
LGPNSFAIYVFGRTSEYYSKWGLSLISTTLDFFQNFDAEGNFVNLEVEMIVMKIISFLFFLIIIMTARVIILVRYLELSELFHEIIGAIGIIQARLTTKKWQAVRTLIRDKIKNTSLLSLSILCFWTLMVIFKRLLVDLGAGNIL